MKWCMRCIPLYSAGQSAMLALGEEVGFAVPGLLAKQYRSKRTTLLKTYLSALPLHCRRGDSPQLPSSIPVGTEGTSA
jgi:hypothetical protein